MRQMEPRLDIQIKLSRMLSYGFIFSLVPFLSIVSIIIGMRAMKMIHKSEYTLSGSVLACWCIGVGGIEAALLIVYFLPIVLSKV